MCINKAPTIQNNLQRCVSLYKLQQVQKHVTCCIIPAGDAQAVHPRKYTTEGLPLGMLI